MQNWLNYRIWKIVFIGAFNSETIIAFSATQPPGEGCFTTINHLCITTIVQLIHIKMKDVANGIDGIDDMSTND